MFFSRSFLAYIVDTIRERIDKTITPRARWKLSFLSFLSPFQCILRFFVVLQKHWLRIELEKKTTGSSNSQTSCDRSRGMCGTRCKYDYRLWIIQNLIFGSHEQRYTIQIVSVLGIQFSDSRDIRDCRVTNDYHERVFMIFFFFVCDICCPSLTIVTYFLIGTRRVDVFLLPLCCLPSTNKSKEQ
jgi:hypothetical protein